MNRESGSALLELIIGLALGTLTLLIAVGLVRDIESANDRVRDSALRMLDQYVSMERMSRDMSRAVSGLCGDSTVWHEQRGTSTGMPLKLYETGIAVRAQQDSPLVEPRTSVGAYTGVGELLDIAFVAPTSGQVQSQLHSHAEVVLDVPPDIEVGAVAVHCTPSDLTTWLVTGIFSNQIAHRGFYILEAGMNCNDAFYLVADCLGSRYCIAPAPTGSGGSCPNSEPLRGQMYSMQGFRWYIGFNHQWRPALFRSGMGSSFISSTTPVEIVDGISDLKFKPFRDAVNPRWVRHVRVELDGKQIQMRTGDS